MHELRPYQSLAIDSLRKALIAGQRPVLSSPTGSGKTRIASEIFSLARSRNRRVAFCVPFLSLINQTYKLIKNNNSVRHRCSGLPPSTASPARSPMCPNRPYHSAPPHLY